MTSSVLTKITVCFCSEHEPDLVQPETREAWRDLATQQWLRGVEVIRCLDYITNVVQTQNMSLPSTQKKDWSVKNCIKEEQEWGSVSWYLSFTHSYFQLPDHFSSSRIITNPECYQSQMATYLFILYLNQAFNFLLQIK